MPKEENQPVENNESGKSWEEQNPEIVHKITIDDYQPYGTLTLTLLYFAVVTLMWIFMYFIEFGGNAPSIID